MIMPMPEREERWIWIDVSVHTWVLNDADTGQLFAPIRAIYFPIAHSTDKDYPQLCTYVQINFALSRTLPVWRGGEEFANHRFDATQGLGIWSDHAVGIDVYNALTLLSMPRQLRKGNVFNLKMIKIVDRTTIDNSVMYLGGSWPEYDFDWKSIANASFGLDLQWKPCQKSTWIESFLKNAITYGSGFVPVMGPLLCVAFPLVWTAIFDPDSFFAEFKTVFPPVDLTDKLRSEITECLNDLRSFIPDGWDKHAAPIQKTITAGEADSLDNPPLEGGPSVAFQLAEVQLASTPKFEEEDEGIVETVVEEVTSLF